MYTITGDSYAYFCADGAVELVNLVLIEAKALTVGRLAVVAVACSALSLTQCPFVELLQLLQSHKLCEDEPEVSHSPQLEEVNQRPTCLISLSGRGTLH